MAEELLVVLNRKDPTCGLGFSLLGTPPGLPPIIYEIVENSPAAESGKVETGDVLLKVNETDVDRLNTKEVLRCLRLSENPVCLRLKRDPIVKARVRHYLSTPHQYRGEMSLPELISDISESSSEYFEQNPPPPLHPPLLEDVTRTNGDSVKEPQPKFEAFVMTGDRVLKICRNQQGSVLPKNQRKVDSLRNHVHNHNNYQRHNSVPTSPTENERHKEKTNSAGTSPTPTSTTPSSSYIVRTSRSEDHLQFNKDSLSAVSIDIDDDVTSSLNTLLDTRPDSENEDQRIVWTYNAPLTDSSNSRTSSSSSSDNISPHRSVSPASPTSVSSSVMSSNSSDSDKRHHEPRLNPIPANTDLSQSEAVSNISSPDFQEEDSEIITRDLVMEVSDPSDSDSTLLVSETNKTRCSTHNGIKDIQSEHRIVIQVKGPDKQTDNHNRSNSPRGQQTRHSSKSSREAEMYNSDVQNAGYQVV